MCELTTALAAISIVSTLAAASAAESVADRQEQSLSRNYELQTAQTYQQYQQLNEQSMEQKSQRAKESWIEEGRLQAALGESGLQTGGTDQRVMSEAGNNAAYDIATLENNRAKASEQAHMGSVGNQAQTQSGYNSIQRPSALGVGLQIAGGVANAYTLGSRKPVAPTE